jgi:cell division transport system permease protein
MTVTVLGIAMLLPLGLHLTLANLERLDLGGEDWGAVTVFLETGQDAERVEALASELRARADVAAVEARSPEDGLAEFRAAAGFGASLDLLDSNPLPWVLSITPVVERDGDAEAPVAALTAALQGRDGVAAVSYDARWLQRLARMLDLGRALVTVLGLLFAVAVVVVVANTIRLDVAARADEIEVLALVGATDGFIRRPFLYSGFWYGLLGGVVAMVLVNAILLYLDGPLGRLLDSYGQAAALQGTGVAETLSLLLGGGLLGLLGALLAVQRYLRQMRRSGTLGRR